MRVARWCAHLERVIQSRSLVQLPTHICNTFQSLEQARAWERQSNLYTAMVDVKWEPWLSITRMLLWWACAISGGLIALKYRRSSSKGWLLYKIICAVILCQAVMMTFKAAYEVSWYNTGDGGLADTLYMVYIPLAQLGVSSFQGLLLLLASGYCITRSDTGPHKPYVWGIPIVILITGTITDFIYFRVTRYTVFDTDFFDMDSWEATLWFFCTLINVCALVMSWVYTFDILQQETEALAAQEQANLQRMQNEADGESHAAPPPMLDPMLEMEGTAYKNLLGAGHNMSHIAGADVEAQEFQTVADRVNFDIKKRMYARFSMGVAAYLVARVCVLLLPVFYLNVVQTVIIFLDFLVQLGFLTTLLVMFRPAEDSPYLMIGGSAEDTEALGMADLGTALEMDPDDIEGANGVPPAVEMAPPGMQRWKQAYTGSSERAGRDQDTRPEGPLAVNGASSSNGTAAAAAAGGAQAPGADAAMQARLPPIRAAGPAHFSLGDEEELMEVQLSSSPPVVPPPPHSKQH